MPQPGGVASGFNHVEVNEQDYKTRLYVCHGKHVVHVKEASYLRDCLFIQIWVFMSYNKTCRSTNRFPLLDHPLIMMTYLFWIRSPKFSSSVAQTHPSKSEQKLLKLCSTSKTHFMRASVKLHLLVSIYSSYAVLEIRISRYDCFHFS
jgi:hypothetical protein